MKKTKDIYILVNAAKCSGRGILQGFIEAISGKPDVSLHICEMSDYGRKSLYAAINAGEVDGLVTSEVEDKILADQFETASFPLVVIGTRERCLPMRKENLRIVTADEHGLSAIATQHLMACGRFASYGYVHFREEFCQFLSRLREEGFLEELRKNNLTGTSYSSNLPEEVSDIKDLGRWILSLPKPAAILVGYDRRAAEVLEACNQYGIHVPDEVRVIGIDNDEIICQQTKPRLSSVTKDNICEGRVAAQQLMALMRRTKNSSPRRTILCPASVSVIERESTRVLAPGLILVQRAHEYITENAGRAVTVNEVIAHLGVSRRLAYLRFKEFGHRTIHQTILAARIAHVKKRLLGSRQKITDISRDCGFANPNNLKIAFRRLTGMSMREWRTQNAHTHIIDPPAS